MVESEKHRRAVLFLRKALGASLLTTQLSGCAEPQESPRATVTDSAGVEIVESVEPSWSASDSTELATEVVVRIGSEAEPLFQVGPIRWVGPDRFAFVNGGTEVRVYAQDGTALYRFGSEGDGPGEFRRISGLAPLSSGHLLVADSRLRRAVEVDSTGGVQRSISFQPPLPSSSHLIGELWWVGVDAGQTSVEAPRLDRRTDTIAAVNLETGERAVWGSTPGSEIVWRTLPNGMPAPISLALGPRSSLAGLSNRVVYGSGDRYELRELDASGRLVRILRRRLPARVPGPEHRQAILNAWEQQGAPEYAEPEFADSLPHFRGLLLDDSGRTWVRIYEGYDRPAPHWDVFDPQGALLSRVSFPVEFVPHAIRDDRVVGVRTDAMGVESVEVRVLDVPWAGSE